MRLILTVLAVLAAGCVVFGGDRTECYVDQFGVKRCRVVSDSVIPSGSHSHVRTDGTILIHSDSNYGNAAAHEGVEWPWYKHTTTETVVGSTIALTESRRAVLFPRARTFVSTVIHNQRVRMSRIFSGRFFGRFCQ